MCSQMTLDMVINQNQRNASSRRYVKVATFKTTDYDACILGIEYHHGFDRDFVQCPLTSANLQSKTQLLHEEVHLASHLLYTPLRLAASTRIPGQAPAVIARTKTSYKIMHARTCGKSQTPRVEPADFIRPHGVPPLRVKVDPSHDQVLVVRRHLLPFQSTLCVWIHHSGQGCKFCTYYVMSHLLSFREKPDVGSILDLDTLHRRS